MILVTILLCGLIGLVLPGYLLSRNLGDQRSAWSTGLTSSIVIMFNVIFWIETVGSPIVPVRVFAVELGLSLALAIIWWLRAARNESAKVAVPRVWQLDGSKTLGACAVMAAVLTGAAVLLRAWLWPLSGADVPFRWGFLPARILEAENFGFYPPITAEDFQHYFFTDGIPPAVSFVYWWIYGTACRIEPWLTFWFVTAQYAAIVFFTYALARRLGSPNAGWFAVAMLACSSRFSNNILIGQESGLLTLSLVALLYHVVTGCQENRWQHFILAGIAAGLGALAREYGWAMLIVGVVTVTWLRGGWRHAVILIATTVVVAGPWYTRTWGLTGNPFYSNSFFGTPVNPMHAAVMNYYVSMLGFKSWTMQIWLDMALLLIVGATWQITLGTVAGLAYLRKYGFLTSAMVVVTLLWAYSMPRTNGGPAYSMRVLCPALPIASVLAGLWVDELSRSFRWVRVGWWIGFWILWPLGLVSTLMFPSDISNPNAWHTILNRRVDPTLWYERLAELPQGTRILADSAYIHTSLYGKGIDVVPIWSPEVAFLLHPAVSGLEARKRLLQANIHWVVFFSDLNGLYLATNVPFYRDDRKNWLPRLTDKSSFAVYELPDPESIRSPLIEHPSP
jgi:hypothetical protein